MMPLRRNQRSFWYASPTAVNPLEDSEGLNGQFGVRYGSPQEGKGNISPATGEKTTRQFGETLDYDEVLIPAPGCTLTEQSVLWVGCDQPRMNADGSFTPPWTHEVKCVAGSLNSTQVALRQVNVR